MATLLHPTVEAPTRTYWCFISYRHADNKVAGRQWASWLNQAIETYDVPEDLVGRVNDRGDTIPDRLYPVFRDEEELPADAELSAPIEKALEQSRFLVVICSPAAAQSTFVNDEIRKFKTLGKASRTLAMIIRGEPNAARDAAKLKAGFSPEDECFPLSLRSRFDAAGNVVDETAEPVGADFRLPDGSEGWTTRKAYRQDLVERGVPAREIASRLGAFEQRRELMKLKIIAGILGVALGVLTERDKAWQLALARRRAKLLRRWLAVVSVLGLLFLAAGVTAFIQWRQADAQRRKAVFSREQAEQLIDYMVGDLQARLAPMGELGLMKSVNQRVASYYRAQGQEGRSPQTLERRAVFYDKLGDVQLAERAWNDAGESYRSALEIRESLALREPGNAQWQWGMCISYGNLGDLYRARGDAATALRYYDIGRKLAQKLVAQDSIRRQWQFFLAGLYEKTGDVQRDQMQPEEALKNYQASLAIREKITPVDSDADGRLGLSECHRRIGDLQFEQEKYAEALADYQAGLALVQKLVQDDPSHISWQQDLGNAHQNVAKTFEAMRQWEESLSHYRKVVEIGETLARRHPGDSRFHIPLGFAHWQMASVLEQVQPGEAKAEWRRGLDVISKLEAQGVSLPDDVKAARYRARQFVEP